jgi:hypothetical protein
LNQKSANMPGCACPANSVQLTPPPRPPLSLVAAIHMHFHRVPSPLCSQTPGDRYWYWYSQAPAMPPLLLMRCAHTHAWLHALARATLQNLRCRSVCHFQDFDFCFRTKILTRILLPKCFPIFVRAQCLHHFMRSKNQRAQS